MGIFSFVKDAGEKLFGGGDAKAAESSTAPSASAGGAGDANAKASEAIKKYIASLGLAPTDLAVRFDGASSVVTVSGTAPDQATKEKILLAAGNVRGVERVEDRMTVPNSEPEGRFHTVASGDTLSAIAKQYYGDANKYNAIFEANKPMLSHPDKIYPGQVLRIPPQG